jgi:hypothetical protein
VIGFCAGFMAIVLVFVAADHVAGSPYAFPFAVLIIVACCALAFFDGKRL